MALLAADFSVLAPSVSELTACVLQVCTHEPLELLQLARMADQHVLGDRVEIAQPLDALAGVLDDAVVDQIQRGQMRQHGVAIHRVVVPGAVVDDGSRRAQRRRAQRCDAFGDLVGVPADQLDLRVDHLVHADEVRPHHIPVHMLEGQVQIVVPTERLLQQLGNLGALFVGHSGHGE